ncbi:hemerythrin domain-containing protein [Streptomyces sp. TLI_171]|uniref:hemerythrin domain-containing protein n=1 Tax=Streptomyces sp. TLI_171 TaxID=1938859 RepID=UPI000C1A31B8|nr:hemerythrin domain-containing protein [Streptomyces sp. TLI_171]RKE17499.1 hemerythrin HHE cation binding domain-containing protein [Streptomyces sp. TLI_171]
MAADPELDLLEQLTTDHEELRTRFGELGELPPGDPRRERLVFVTADTLLRHLVAEEQHLYPIARHGRPRGDQVVDHGLQSHAALRGLVRELGRSPSGPAGFDRLVAQLIEVATDHFHREETELFPTVREHSAPVRLTALGAEVRATERAASGPPTG